MRSLESSYVLLQAFDRLGRHLFGHEWTGQEFHARPVRAPEEIAEEIATLERRIADLDGAIQERDAAISRTLDADEIARLKDEKSALSADRTEASAPLYQLQQTSYGRPSDWERFRRRSQAEDVLFSALRKERLTAETPYGLQIDWAAWEQEPGFVCHLDLSLVRVPQYRSSIRRLAVIFRSEPFDAWLKTILPIAESALAEISPEHRCRAWLIEFVAAHTHPVPKLDVQAKAQQLIPDLSKRAFDRIWSDTVPEHWRQAGRPKASKNHLTPPN